MTAWEDVSPSHETIDLQNNNAIVFPYLQELKLLVDHEQVYTHFQALHNTPVTGLGIISAEDMSCENIVHTTVLE